MATRTNTLNGSESETLRFLFEEMERIREDSKLGKITGDEISFHNDPARTDFVMPQGLTYNRVYEILRLKEKQENEVTAFTHDFPYRVDDGLNAVFEVVKQLFGITKGKTLKSFFGDIPPEMKSIKVGVRKTKQVYSGRIEIPALEGAVLTLGAKRDREYGIIFSITAECKNKYRKIIDSMFAHIERYLATNSIYRGHALAGADSLDFIDVSTFDASQIVLSADVEDVLKHELFGPIGHSTLFELDGVDLKRAFLLHGPYGTGKSSIGLMTAQVAEQAGWTYIAARTARDSIEDVLKTAALYEPAVVFVEDIDVQASTGDPTDVSKLLDVFDGITAKDKRIIIVLTTNHVDRIHKGVLRPGRLDNVVEVGSLDRGGIEKLIRVQVGDHRIEPNTDFNKLWDEMHGFEPAFVKATAKRAKTRALGRTGTRDYVLTTEDLVGAARSLQPQLRLLQAAGEGKQKPILDTAFRETVVDVLHSQKLVDIDGGKVHSYTAEHMVTRDKDNRSDPNRNGK